MPNRILREGILSSERVDRIAWEPPVEVTYRRLYSVADDFGRFTAHPSLVRAAIYPLRLDAYTDAQIGEHLRACESAGLIRLYAVENKPYLEVLSFNQRTRAKRSKYPPPEGHRTLTVVAGIRRTRARNVTVIRKRNRSRETETRDGDAISIHWLRQSKLIKSLPGLPRRTPLRLREQSRNTCGPNQTTTLSFKPSKPAAVHRLMTFARTSRHSGSRGTNPAWRKAHGALGGSLWLPGSTSAIYARWKIRG